MTTQSPTWRDQSSGNPPTGDRATPGTIVGERYELKTPIGNGGMGTVWRATDTLLRRDVAVKEVILPPQMPQSEKDALCERTLREARAAAALSHPSVVQVYDVVTDAGRPWIVMELLEARSLADMVIDDGPMAPRAVAKIGIAMLGALEVAHAAGVLHRDVKPANVLICTDGRCVLTDFGVARLPTESKLTTPGMVLGSPHFISPERAVGGAFGPPSDLFSLGVTLYTAVEGGPPFDRGDPFETMRAVVEEAPRPARLAGPLEPVLWGLLDKEPSRRWSVEQARTNLRELLTGTLGPARNAHLRHDTDPVAVIRPPAGPPPAIRSGSQVGGRAMLDPDEPLSAQITRRTGGIPGTGGAAAPPPPAAAGGGGRVADTRRTSGRDSAQDSTWDTPQDSSWDSSHGSTHGSSWDSSQGSTHGSSWDSSQGSSWDSPQGSAYGSNWADDATTAHEPRPSGAGRRRAPSSSAVLAEQVAGRVRAMRHDMRGTPNRSRLIVAGGLVMLLLIVGIVTLFSAFSGGDDPQQPPGVAGPSGGVSGAPAKPLIEAQEYRDRGIAVNVPAGWDRGGAGSYVDYRDPGDARWVRINIETTTSNAMGFLKNASNALANPDRCPAPYTEVALHEAQLAGQNGAELEYTCGDGTAKRHGIWRALIKDGNAYHFYLTVPDARFGESKIIFDEMVRSFIFV